MSMSNTIDTDATITDCNKCPLRHTTEDGTFCLHPNAVLMPDLPAKSPVGTVPSHCAMRRSPARVLLTVA